MRSIILAAMLLAVPATAHAGDLVGKVYDPTALPVAGALVMVGEQETITLADGSFRFAGLAAGEHEIAVRLADGAVQRVWADLDEAGAVRRNVFLMSAAALRGAREFASEGAASATAAPAVDVPQLPAGEGAVAAWRWRDTDA